MYNLYNKILMPFQKRPILFILFAVFSVSINFMYNLIFNMGFDKRVLAYSIVHISWFFILPRFSNWFYNLIGTKKRLFNKSVFIEMSLIFYMTYLLNSILWFVYGYIIFIYKPINVTIVSVIYTIVQIYIFIMNTYIYTSILYSKYKAKLWVTIIYFIYGILPNLIRFCVNGASYFIG